MSGKTELGVPEKIASNQCWKCRPILDRVEHLIMVQHSVHPKTFARVVPLLNGILVGDGILPQTTWLRPGTTAIRVRQLLSYIQASQMADLRQEDTALHCRRIIPGP